MRRHNNFIDIKMISWELNMVIKIGLIKHVIKIELNKNNSRNQNELGSRVMCKLPYVDEECKHIAVLSARISPLGADTL